MTASKPNTRTVREPRPRRVARTEEFIKKAIQQCLPPKSPLESNTSNSQLQDQAVKEDGEQTPTGTCTQVAGHKDGKSPARLRVDSVKYDATPDDDREEGECTPEGPPGYLSNGSFSYGDPANYQAAQREETNHFVNERSDHMAYKHSLEYLENDDSKLYRETANFVHGKTDGRPYGSNPDRRRERPDYRREKIPFEYDPAVHVPDVHVPEDRIPKDHTLKDYSNTYLRSANDRFSSYPFGSRLTSYSRLSCDESESAVHSKRSSHLPRRPPPLYSRHGQRPQGRVGKPGSYRRDSEAPFSWEAVNRRRTLEAYTSLALGRSVPAEMRDTDRRDAGSLPPGTIISAAHHSQGRGDIVDPYNPNLTWSTFGPVHSKYRKMVIIGKWGEHFNCVPMYTYNGKGLGSYGANSLHRANISDEYIGIREGGRNPRGKKTQTESRDTSPYRPLIAYRDRSWLDHKFISDASLIKITEVHMHNVGDKCSIEGRLDSDDLIRLVNLISQKNNKKTLDVIAQVRSQRPEERASY
ncbi:hypothetical protein QQZ08_010604 [Neonectria magnoliae]|uniref:DUF6590 domain-containing protein n=1 Tax=Neonectria magnoliae TaxID=2732573 RepID=A0ABR1HFJ3_9HYPO